MKLLRTVITIAILLTACTASAKPTSLATQAPVKTGSSPSAGSAATGVTKGPCKGAGTPGHAYAIALVRDASVPAVRDVTDLDHGSTVCLLPAGARYARFRNATQVSFVLTGTDIASPGDLVQYDLATGSTNTLVHLPANGFLAGLHAWSPDGASLTYLLSDTTAVEWHLRTGQDDRVLAKLPPVPGRGLSSEYDDAMLAFSPDGKYVALEQTFTGESGQTAGLQVRAADGSLVLALPASGPALSLSDRPTMAAWANPAALYYRTDSGVWRWTPGATPSLVLSGLRWLHPDTSLGLHLIAFSEGQGDEARLQLFEWTGGAITPVAGQHGLDHPHFLGTAGVWAFQWDTCASCPFGFKSSGKTFIYELGPKQVSESALVSVADSWPR